MESEISPANGAFNPHLLVQYRKEFRRILPPAGSAPGRDRDT